MLCNLTFELVDAPIYAGVRVAISVMSEKRIAMFSIYNYLYVNAVFAGVKHNLNLLDAVVIL